MRGIVLKSTGSWYQVRTKEGEIIHSRIKGKIRLQELKTTNPIAVGDEVEFEIEPGKETGIISDILPRKNYIIRQSPKHKNAHHVIASNMDQAILVATIASPKTPLGFIDRFLATAELYHIPSIIVFNKSDLYDKGMTDEFNAVSKIYVKAGYEVILTSAQTGKNLDKIRTLILNKTSLLSGQSGVGKSSLVNTLFPGINLKTGSVSDYHQKGTHTTTFAEMHELPEGGFIMDTPGIKEFGLVNVTKDEIGQLFPEMRKLSVACKFNNCMHVNEPKCAVKKAAESGEITETRYKNYLAIVEDLKDINFWEV